MYSLQIHRQTDLWSLTPDNLSSLRDQAQLTDIDLYDCSFCNDSQRGVEGRGGILLYSKDGQAECGLQLRVRDMSLFETQTLKDE